MATDHYENFPVASWLCPPEMRPAVMAIYRFARTADDIADEGMAPAGDRIALLNAYEADLRKTAAGLPPAQWADVFGPVARALRQHALPLTHFVDLLDAFRQDCDNPRYPDRTTLLGYCARSANPIGRLLLHLAHVDDPIALAQSDAVCSALQLINFWQDLSIDLPRSRCYVPAADAARHGLALDDLRAGDDTHAARALVAELCAWSRELMLDGAPLVFRLPGRFGWELRGVVQGGLRILDKIEASGFNSMLHRPTVTVWDAPRMMWRAMRMRAAPGAPQAAAAAGRVAP